MTSAVTSDATGDVLVPGPVAAPEQARRMLSIAANLLPAEIIDSRRTRAVRRAVVSGLAACTLLLGAWYAQARHQTGQAQDALTTRQDEVRSLLRQQRSFSELASTRRESEAIRTQLRTLLANDLQWSSLLSSLQQAAPKGVLVTGVFGALSSGTGGGAAVQLPGGSGKKLIGTLTVSGSGPDEATVAAYVDALACIPGLQTPFLTDAARRDGALEFTVRLDMTEALFDGRYTGKTGSTPGGA